MKYLFILLCLIIALSIGKGKSVEKLYPKKVPSINNKPKEVLEQFSSLPSDDLEFIKEIDKQFKEHGDGIKFKIEKENSTVRNSKRTIDGSLGYGYQQNNYKYEFSRPKYLIYPYSQRDIPLNGHQYDQQYKLSRQSGIEITPSRAFEIKETPNQYNNYPTINNQNYLKQTTQQSYNQYQYQDEPKYIEPVIVLRIPGPAKYAAHLQSLLQRYLELRAAQYLKILQQTDNNNIHNNYDNQYYDDISNGQNTYEQDEYEEVSPTYYHAAIAHHNGYNEDNTNQKTNQYNSGGHILFNQNNNQDHNNNNNIYRQQSASIFDENNSNVQHSIIPVHQHQTNKNYVNDDNDEKYVTEHPELPISENYPSDTHTKAYFTGIENKISNHRLTYQPTQRLPIITKYNYENVHQNNNIKQLSTNIKNENIIPITQRTNIPFNYHAHTAITVNTTPKGNKRHTISTERQFDKLNRIINRIKDKTNSERNNSN